MIHNNHSTFANKVNKILAGQSKVSSPTHRTKKTNKADEEKLEAQLKILEKQRMIMELREQNLNLKQKLEAKSNSQRKNNQTRPSSLSKQQKNDKKLVYPSFQKIIQESSFSKLEHCSTLQDLTNKLQSIFGGNFTFTLQSLVDIAKSLEKSISEDGMKKAANNFFKDINENLNLFPINQINQSITKISNDFKQELKRQANLLQQKISKTIDEKQEIFRALEEVSSQKREEMMKSLSQNLNFLKDYCGKKQQQLKKQINLLQGKLSTAINDSLAVISSQNNLITDLRESLLQLREAYHMNVQIPIISVRQQVQKEIKRLKQEMSNANRNIKIKDLIGDLISTLKKYQENRSSSNYLQIGNHVRQIGEKLNVVNEHSIKTIQELREVVNQNRQSRVKINLGEKVNQLSEKFSSKKKVKEEIQLEIKYFKQKQYIEALQKYTKKLEQSILRNQPTLSAPLQEQWQNFECQYRNREKEFSIRLANLQVELSTDTRQLLETKKTAMSVLQTQKTLVVLFEGFQSEIGIVKSFKDQLFNFLENQLQFHKSMNHQIQIFNRVFVQQFTRLSELQQSLPVVQEMGNPEAVAQLKLISSFKDAILNAQKLACQYEKLFKIKEKADPQLNKNSATLERIHSQYSRLLRQKSPICITFDGQAKFERQDILVRLQSLVAISKKSSETISSNLEKFNHCINDKAQQINNIKQFIKSSKLQHLIQKAYDMMSQKQNLLLDIQKHLLAEQNDNFKERGY